MLACFIALIAQQSAPPSITYTNFGARTEVVLGELSKLYGQPLKADDSVKDQPLTIRVDGVSPDDLLAKIALVDDGKWIVRQNVKTLIIDFNARDKRIAAEAQQNYRIRLEGLKGYLKDCKTDDSLWHKALGHLIEQIGPETIAQGDPGYAQVYATRPSPLEHPLPDLDQSDLVGLTYAGFDTTSKRGPKVPDGSRVVVSFMANDGNPARALGAVVTVVGPNNETIANDYLNLLSDDPTSERKPTPLELLAQKSPVSIPVTKAIQQLTANLRKHAPLDPALRARLMDPYKNDPTALAGEMIVGWANAQKVQMVAALRDDVVLLVVIDGFALSRPGGIESLLGSEDASFDGQWVTVRSKPLQTSSSAAIVRPQASQQERSSAYPDLVNTSAPTFSQIVQAYRLGLNEIFPGYWLWQELYRSAGNAEAFLDWYECLTQSDISLLNTGRPVAISQLGDQAKDYIVKAFLGNGGPAINWLGKNVKPGQMPGLLLDNAYEVADALIPSGATVVFKKATVPAFLYPSQQKDGGLRSATSMQEVAELFGDDLKQPIIIGSAEKISYEFHFAGNVDGGVMLHLYHFPENSPKYLPSELPADLKHQFDQGRQQVEEARNRIRSFQRAEAKP